MNNEKNTCNCDESCTCGCQDGKECTCHESHCDCGCHEHDCGCQDGGECTCGDDCHCGEHCDCGCHEHDCGCQDGGECTCGDDCHCGEKLSAEDIFKQYETAFRQLEDALIKADKELEETKKVAESNERLAITYKKDLERFKERTKEEQENIRVSIIADISDELIPVLDNFEQALKVSGDPKIMKGFEMIEGMLKNAVKALGIEEIDALGREFDPELHNAVGKKKTKDAGKANTIATVYQKGYKMANSGKVIRHSMVEIYLYD